MTECPETTETIQERGPWRAGKGSLDAVMGVFIQSNDFTHDVLLYVDGDFTDEAERFRYAEEIARRLNAWKPQP